MLIARIRKNRDKRKKLAHIIAGIIILVHAYERYEDAHASYVFFAIAGVVFLLIALLHSVIEKKAPWIDGVFFIIEAGLSFLVAWDYFELGKKGLPFCYLAVGIVQVVLAFVKSKKAMVAHSTGNRPVHTT